MIGFIYIGEIIKIVAFVVQFIMNKSCPQIRIYCVYIYTCIYIYIHVYIYIYIYV